MQIQTVPPNRLKLSLPSRVKPLALTISFPNCSLQWIEIIVKCPKKGHPFWVRQFERYLRDPFRSLLSSVQSFDRRFICFSPILWRLSTASTGSLSIMFYAGALSITSASRALYVGREFRILHQSKTSKGLPTQREVHQEDILSLVLFLLIIILVLTKEPAGVQWIM